MKLFRSTRYRWMLLTLYVAGVLVATLAPIPDTGAAGLLASEFDKPIHALLMAGYVLLISRCVRRPSRLRPVAAIGGSVVLATAIELLQWPIPFRSGDVLDLLAGAAGSVVAYGAVWGVERRTGAAGGGVNSSPRSRPDRVRRTSGAVAGPRDPQSGRPD